MAHALELGDKMISINLLPMTLVNEPDAVSLLNEIKANALVPEQIIVEFTESEVISRFDEFAEAIKSLKAAGISVAIDHFGAGFAGLLLLSRFQPDRIKISQELITNVHKKWATAGNYSGDHKMLYITWNSSQCYGRGNTRRVDVAWIRRNWDVSGRSVC